MTKVRFVEACYASIMRWDVESIAQENNFKLEDIDYMYVGKWVQLFIHLKDGEVCVVDSGDHDWYNYFNFKRNIFQSRNFLAIIFEANI